MRRLLVLPIALLAIAGCGDDEPDRHVENAGHEKRPQRGTERPKSDTPDVRFKSVFWASIIEDGEPRVEPIRDRVSLAGGTELGWIVEVPPELHLYVFHHGDDGTYTPLELEGDGAMRTVLPRGTQLDDNPGLERFYMIASRAPLERLDALVADLTGPDKTAAATALNEEIAGLRRRYEDRERKVGRPTRIGGSVRGDNPADHAIWYEASQVGVWTFTIEHR